MSITIDLKSKLALVTGATGEMGRTIARALATAGADVAIHYHSSAENAEKLLQEVRAAGVRADIFQADITQPDSVNRMRQAVEEKLGNPDILVNNAVALYDWKTVLEQKPEDYESQFRSSVLQNVLMAQAFVPSMIHRKWGRIIAINTECVMQCAPTASAYVSGKRGMDGVLRVLAREVGEHQITVNQVAPGWTITDKIREAGVPAHHPYDNTVALRCRGEDKDIANAVIFLASDLARFITGAIIPVCGGSIMPAI